MTTCNYYVTDYLVKDVIDKVDQCPGVPCESGPFYINDVFSLMICIKELLPHNRTAEFSEMVGIIDGQLKKLSSKIHTININDT